MTETFDHRRGLAGAVLANRLSEDGTRRILLLEAGSAYSPNLYPPDLANADIAAGGLGGSMMQGKAWFRVVLVTKDGVAQSAHRAA